MRIPDALKVRQWSENLLRLSYGGQEFGFKEMQTVVVSRDFSRYVAAMADQWPPNDVLDWPSMEDVGWPFPNHSTLFVFEEPIFMEFLITSEDNEEARVPIMPFRDEREVVAMFLLDNRLMNISVEIDGTAKRRLVVPQNQGPYRMQASVFIHPDTSTTSGYFNWGLGVTRNPAEDRMGYCARWERSFAEAVGHRMSVVAEPQNLPRHERRAIQRTEAPYRVLDLRTPERAKDKAGTRKVEWTKRWGVRGHWRNQPYGPRKDPKYRRIWIDWFLKGPEDKPLDIRPTIFKLDNPSPKEENG